MRIFVSFLVFAAVSFFFDEFECRAEVVLVSTPFIGVEVIDELDQLRVVQAVISQKVSEEGPVFLLNMGVVVFLVRPGTGKFDFRVAIGEVAQEMMVQKLRAIVADPARGQVEQNPGFSSLPYIQSIHVFPITPTRIDIIKAIIC